MDGTLHSACDAWMLLERKRSVGSYKEHWLDKPTSQDLKNIWEDVSFLLSCVWMKDLRISVTQRFFSSRWEGCPRICHLSKLMTVKNHAASINYVNVGYQTEEINLWTNARVQALQSLHTMEKIESDSNVACLQYNKKSQVDLEKQQDAIRGESGLDVRKIFQMTARNYDVLKMIQLRVSELL